MNQANKRTYRRPIGRVAIGTILIGMLFACDSQSAPKSEQPLATIATASPTTSPSPTSPASPPPSATMGKPNVGSFSTDELFAQGGGGCGMTLWQPEQSQQRQFILFHGIDDAPMWMRIDDQMMQLQRTTATGKAFYGQKTTQSFETPDGSIKVNVNVTLGEPGEIESVSIPAATIDVEQGAKTVSIQAIGDAGC